MGWTSPRVQRVVAAAHQTAFGTAASSGGTLARAAGCLASEFRRGQIALDQQGTHGSEYPRDTRAEVATMPSATLRLYAGSRAFLALLLEHATHGQPTATSAAGDLVESGDTAAVLTTWSLTGVRPGFNTDAGNRIYVKLEDETPGAGQARVSLYSDSARTALVAQGSAADSSTITLAEQNSSGLSGTVALAAPSASNLTGIQLSVVTVRPQRATIISRYFTIFRDSGQELETISDCTVRSLRLESSFAGGLIVEVEIVGSTYAIGASVLTPSVAAAEREVFVHAEAVVTHNANAQSVFRAVHGLGHDVIPSLANAAAPAALWKRGSMALPIVLLTRLASESRTIRDDGAAGTWRQIVMTYTFGPRVLSVTYPRAILVAPELPATGDLAWEDHRLTFDARDDGTNAPVQITLGI